MSEERLQKILARAGVAARRRVEEMIEEGRITVNGQVAELGQKADPQHDAIKVDGKRIHLQVDGPHTYLLLNKPRGVMSTVSDPEGRPTVLELVPAPQRKALVPVGRLDFLTEGLLLLTDDGEFANRVAHPRFGCTKTYEVKVKGRPDEQGLDRIRGGMVLDGRRTAPVTIESRTGRLGFRTGENSWWMVGLIEGRTRQIREMFFRIGHPVQRLRRVGIGSLRDPDLAVGQIRELTEAEVERLREPQPPLGEKASAPKSTKKSHGKGWARAKPRPKSGVKAGGAKSSAKKPSKSSSKSSSKAPSKSPRAGGATRGATSKGPAGKSGEAGGRAPGSRGPGSRSPGSRGPGSRGSGSGGPSSAGAGTRGPGSSGPGSRGPGSRGPSGGAGGRGPGSRGPGGGAGGRGPGSRGPGGAGGRGPGRPSSGGRGKGGRGGGGRGRG